MNRVNSVIMNVVLENWTSASVCSQHASVHTRQAGPVRKDLTYRTRGLYSNQTTGKVGKGVVIGDGHLRLFA